MAVILASQSPRRRELLERMGISDFLIRPAQGEELFDPSLTPAQLVETLSRQKAEEISAGAGPADVVIAADTVVAVDGRVLGKPGDEAEAAEMLAALSGREHTVYTGVTVRRGGETVTEHEATAVRFRPLTGEEIADYVATGEPMDKAGAYGIQGYGCLLVEGISGDYFNVVGGAPAPGRREGAESVKDFLRRNGIWLLVIALLLSILIGVSSAFMGGNADPLSNLVTTITTPVRNGAAAVGDWVQGVSRYVFHYGEMEQQISDLEEENAQLQEQIRESQEALQENELLRNLLDLRERRRDFVFESAKVTARSNDNWRSTLTLSKGSESGIQEGNCVVTSTGVLVGVVSEVGSHYSTVSTVIDTSMEMGGIITRTNAAGVLEGDFSLMQEGRLRLSYLPDGAELVAGDEVLTSGRGDVYPSGLVVGRVEGVFSDASGMNRYAVVVPEVDLSALVEVFVIKEFDIVE